MLNFFVSEITDGEENVKHERAEKHIQEKIIDRKERL